MEPIPSIISDLRREWKKGKDRDILVMFHLTIKAIETTRFTSPEIARLSGIDIEEFRKYRNLTTYLDPMIAEAYVEEAITYESARHILQIDRGQQGEVLRLLTSGSLVPDALKEFVRLNVSGMGIRESNFAAMNQLGLSGKVVTRDTESTPPHRLEYRTQHPTEYAPDSADYAVKVFSDALGLLQSPEYGNGWNESGVKRVEAVRRLLREVI